MTAGPGDLPRACAYVVATATVAGVLTDLTDLADHLAAQPLPIAAGQAGHAAVILTRLAQECAEAAYLLQARPGRPQSPLPAYTRAATAVIADAAASERDFGGWVALVLSMAAARKGSSAALVRNRPGGWAATLVLQLVRGTVGQDDEFLAGYAEEQL